VTSRDLDAASIERQLSARGVSLGLPVSVLPTTSSTNDDAKRAGQKGAPSGSAFLADCQSAGRGRLGRSWHSPPGQNLYLSFLLRPRLDPRAARLLTLAVGLAVRDAIAPLLPACAVGIKWPNDVLIDGRKVAGILAEAQLAGAEGFVVVGIGVNVRAAEFPPELRAKATSLALAGAHTLDRGQIFVEIAACLQKRLEQLAAGALAAIVDDVARHDALRGRLITVDGEPAVALGLAPDGALRIRRKDGSEGLVNAGDVQPSEPGSGLPPSTN
jgi:BirA family biotin operon repressor/biotin-[acetyl-CoA-carboxylase] ligase